MIHQQRLLRFLSAGAVVVIALMASVVAAPPAAASTGLPVVTTEPLDVVTTVGGQVTLIVIADAPGDPSDMSLWFEKSTDAGQTWTRVGGCGVNPGTEIFCGSGPFVAQLSDNGTLYRAVVTNAAGTTTSRSALLTVCDASSCIVPSFAVTPDHDLISGQQITATATGLPPSTDVTLSTCVANDSRCSAMTPAVTGADGSLSASFPVTRVFLRQDCLAVACEARVRIGAAPFGRAPISFLPPIPTVIPGSASVLEGDTATVDLKVPVTLSNRAAQTVTVPWSTIFLGAASPIEADPATDYTATNGTLTFLPGETAKSVTITVSGDRLDERDELLLVSFGSPTNATLGGFWGLGFGGITNDDHAVVTPGHGTVVEGDDGTTVLEVPFSSSNPSTQVITVQWTTMFVPGWPPGQADPGTDYTAASGTATLRPGETAGVVSIAVSGERLVEADEYLLVLFGNATNASIGGWGLGFGSIVNDD